MMITDNNLKYRRNHAAAAFKRRRIKSKILRKLAGSFILRSGISRRKRMKKII